MILSDRSKRVTIKDVAHTAGVSTQTVSRVMNKFYYVLGKSWQHVKVAAEQTVLTDLSTFTFFEKLISSYLQLLGRQSLFVQPTLVVSESSIQI